MSARRWGGALRVGVALATVLTLAVMPSATATATAPAPESTIRPLPAPTPDPTPDPTADPFESPAPETSEEPVDDQELSDTSTPMPEEKGSSDNLVDRSIPAAPFAGGEGNSFCTSGVWSLAAGELDMHPVDAGVLGNGSGWFRELPVDGLAITPDGTDAYAAAVTEGQISIQRLGAQLGYSEYLTPTATTLTQVTAGAINPAGTHYYYGDYVVEGSAVYFELHAYNIDTDADLGRVLRVQMPAAVTEGGGGDIVFTAQGDLLLLWSNAGGTASALASVTRARIPLDSGDRTPILANDRPAPGANPTGATWNGLAFDSIGRLWIQGASATDTVVGQINPDTGAVTELTTTAGVSGVDLASCGSSTTLVVKKNVISRLGSDQFRLRIGSSGSSDELATATTSGTATGVQPVQAGAVAISEGARYTIAESGANGASPGNYTTTYACLWARGGEPFVAPTPLPYSASTGRAQALLPAIPAGHKGDNLTCTISNTAKTPEQSQPNLVLKKELIGNRVAGGDQFRLAVLRGGTELRTTTTTGTGSTVGSSETAPVVAEHGQTYTISETAATGDLAEYTGTFRCEWSGGGEFARGALQPSDGRMQTQLPAIPSDRSGQTLTCTLKNQPKPTSGLDCSAPTIYAHLVSGSAGAAHRVTETGFESTAKVNFNVPATSAGYNAFAINRDGSQAIAALLAPTGARTTLTLRVWSASTNAVTTPNPAVTGPTLPQYLVGGAIDPTNGDYYFGGYKTAAAPNASNSEFALFVLRAGATTYSSAGSVIIPNSTTASGNGDITFDASGNLYLVWSTSGNHRLARLNADKVTAGGLQVATQLSTWNTTGQTYNGVAFNGEGKLWVSYSGGIRIIDPAIGATPNDLVIAKEGLVDLASCGLPPTMKLEKNLTSRVKATDQFKMEILSGTTVAQTATTAGVAVGVQPEVAGPMVVTVGQQYTIRETALGGANLNDYITSYSCMWSDDKTPFASGILSGSPTTRSQLLEPVYEGKPGQQLACTITNEPLIPARITVKKTLLDARGENPTAGGGWEISTELTRSQSETLTPTSTQQTTPTGAVPSPWEIAFVRSSDSVDVRVAETPKTGFRFVDGSCSITPRVGESRVVAVTSESADLAAVRPGDRVECEFRNQPLPGSVTWQKVAEGTPVQHLGGSVWALSGPGVPTGTLVEDCIGDTPDDCLKKAFADRDPRPGHFRLDDLSKGNHTLVEETAPPGYIRDSQPHRLVIEVLATPPSCLASEVGVGGVPRCLHVDFDQPFVNRQQSVPVLPLTGGMSTDAFLLAGGLAGALATATAWFAHRRARTSRATGTTDLT